MRVSGLALAVALALAAGPGSAQPVAPAEPEPTVVYLKTTALDFTGAAIEAELTRPTGSFTKTRSPVKFRNLIELRANFRPELARSASRLPATVP